MRITFQPSGKSVDAPGGINLADACRLAGFDIATPCGGKGGCGKCRVRVLEGAIPVDAAQEHCLPPSLLAKGWRASCVAAATGDLVLADPEEADAGIVLTDFSGVPDPAVDAVWRRRVDLPKPGKDDQRDDRGRLGRALAENGIENLEMPLPLLRRLPELLRDADFSVETVGAGSRLLAVRRRDDRGPLLGLAVDLGTTTLAAVLCDLETGRALAVRSAANPQAIRGDDVVSRIDYAARGREERDEMRRLAVDAVRNLANESLDMAGLAGRRILLVAVGGNTVMNHLLLGVDPKPLALSPFIPCFREIPCFGGEAIGWPDEPAPLFLAVPNIAAYVGGDVAAGILAHGVAETDRNVLFLDIGTNGEIVLRANGVTYACACAAGPAFEGARIKQGMRAVPGAISEVRIGPGRDLDVSTVLGRRPAVGICGTGLLDAAAALLNAGAVDETGRLLDADEAEDEGVAAKIVARLHHDEDGAAVWLERPGDGNDGVLLTQRDVRELQLAKGALAAGVRVLLNAAGMEAADLDAVLLAGGFGNYLRPESALAVGILPPGIRAETIQAVGNAALAGTRLYLLSREERARASAISARIRYIELSGRDDFQHFFAEEMLFPSRMA